MKELTRIWSVELTEIINGSDDYIEELLSDLCKSAGIQQITKKLKEIGFCDINFTQIQDSVRDIEEEKSDKNSNDPFCMVATFVDELIKNTIDIPGVSVCANFRDNSISIFVSRDEEEEDD